MRGFFGLCIIFFLILPVSAQNLSQYHDGMIAIIEEVDSSFCPFYYKKNEIPAEAIDFLKQRHGKNFRLTNSKKKSSNSRKLSFATNRDNIWIVGFEEETWGSYTVFYFLSFEERDIKEICSISLGGHQINWYQFKDMIRRRAYSAH